jgi:hypothetical protein
VIFASYGDNITPPHQALGWIPVVYKDTGDLKAAGQRIVYLTNPHAGHLGIFVSAKVARFEHRAILESLQEIEALAPGLYEMKIDNPMGDPDCHKPQYSVRFEARDVRDLKFQAPHQAFERVRQVSEANERLYQTCLSPVIRAFANPWAAAVLEWLHPMRISRYLFSETFSPWMSTIADLAHVIETHRTPPSSDDPYVVRERAAVDDVTKLIEDIRKRRDLAEERAFALVYGVTAPLVASQGAAQR